MGIHKKDCLQVFDGKTADWFRETLGKPTAVQEASWPAIAEGGHVLVSAPTGTGKTLSAFLVFLDRFMVQAEKGELKQELQLIYVSPLKSLAGDIRENLKKPLEGIGGEEFVKVAIRTGDTLAKERQQMIRKPPHILIITPESLYLMLTSKTGQNMLCTAKAVIVDELHALIDTKRGAHLMLSLARLDILCKKPLQRIGLSATISPLSQAAEYLAPEPVFVAAPAMEKKIELQVLGSYVGGRSRKKDPVWQELSLLVYQYCQGSRSVIAFVEGRRYAEKLAYYVNLLGGKNFARVHHGSLSKEQRMETEQALREGRLCLLCATSSMELGIDVGEIDQVLQVGCPRTVSGTMQRLGRAGHNPSRTSVMYMFPRTPAECISCGMTAQLAREGYVEAFHPPENCLDILAQHLVSMAAFRKYTLDEVMQILPRAWPFRYVEKEDVKSLLEMLAGDYEHKKDIPVRPRILYDRIHEMVEGDGYSRMLAISAGGTIPDRGLYTVRTEEGVKLGEVDEEFVYETRKGDRFILGAFAWKVSHISRDTVTVSQAPVEGARLPFWKGELKGRSKETGRLFGRMFRKLSQAEEDGKLEDALMELGLDEAASVLAGGYLKRQKQITGGLPDDKTILAEYFKDQSGHMQLMFHSVFGRQVNTPLSLLAARAAEQELGENVGCVDEEDGFLLYSYGEKPIPEKLLFRISPESVADILSALLPATPVFNMAFRYNCGRALMMGVRKNSRQPLWMQRLRSAEMLEQVVREENHPLIRETKQECMMQLWDVEGVKELLEKIHAGEITVREIYTETPSPMSLPLQWAQEAAVMYDYAPTPQSIHRAVEDALEQEEEKLLPGRQELSQVQTREKLPENEKQLHSLLMTEGDLTAGELDIPIEWLETLAEEERAVYLEQGLWIAVEQEMDYREALDGQEIGKAMDIVRRMLRYRGGMDAKEIGLRYGRQQEWVSAILDGLLEKKEIICQKELKEYGIASETELRGISRDFSEDAPVQTAGIPVYYHAELYKRARIKTVKNRREEIRTSPPEAYAALLLSRLRRQAPPKEALAAAISSLTGVCLPAAAWEEIVFPARVRNYRGNLLDGLLSRGEYFWHMEEKGRLAFDPVSQIDWEQEPKIYKEEFSGQERLIVEALARRGASFMQTFNGILEGESPYGVFLSLIEKGIVNADSFVPVRSFLSRGKTEKAPIKRRVAAHVKTMSAGRFDLVRSLLPLTIEEQMDRCFDRYLVLCRETAAACSMPWQEALAFLRVQEYTGQVRRGYFVEGLSGAQFIRQKDFEGVTAFLLHPEEEIYWLNAADPMQPWGKLLPHRQGREFTNIAGTAVAFRGGLSIALFEKQGKIFRCFEEKYQEEAIALFAEEYQRGQIFPGKKRIVVKEYSASAAGAFEGNGFVREMLDYVLYRKFYS